MLILKAIICLVSDGYKLRKSDYDFDDDNSRDNSIENNFINYLRDGKKEKSELNYKFNNGREGEDDRAQQILYVYQTNFIFKGMHSFLVRKINLKITYGLNKFF
jgi:hypothetical protein